jgi:hypothetical protein
VRLEAERSEPDDVGVYRDVDDGAAEGVVPLAGAGIGRGLAPGGGVELAEALPLWPGPLVGTESAVDGVRGVADRVTGLPRVVVAQLGEAAALSVENLGELADVELVGVGAGGGADPEPVAAADGQVRRQVACDGLRDARAVLCSGGMPGTASGGTPRGRAGTGRGRASRAGRSWPGAGVRRAAGTNYGQHTPPTATRSGRPSDRPRNSDPLATATSKIIPNKTDVHPPGTRVCQ